MKIFEKSNAIFASILSVAMIATLGASIASGSVVYVGGPFYKEADSSLAELKASGFDTVIIWTIHIDENGNFNFNGEFPIVQNGVYIGDQTYPNFSENVLALKQGETSVNRVEFGLSGARSGTFRAVRNFFQADGGFGPDTVLYKNFKALRDAVPGIDAFNNNDENTHDLESTIAFSNMINSLGFENTMVPVSLFRAIDYWNKVAEQANFTRVYLQVYDFGDTNNPCSSIWDYGIPVIPGLSSRSSSVEGVKTQMGEWRERCGITSGFMWLYDDFKGEAADYAQAINSGISSVSDQTIRERERNAQQIDNQIAAQDTARDLQALENSSRAESIRMNNQNDVDVQYTDMQLQNLENAAKIEQSNFDNLNEVEARACNPPEGDPISEACTAARAASEAARGE